MFHLNRYIWPFVAVASVLVLLAPCSLAIWFYSSLAHQAYLNRNHLKFAAQCVDQIEPARQMESTFKDCRHFITIGPQDVPLFNSVAYFGDRYQLTMQVPVQIDSPTAGKIVGSPQFILLEVGRVDVTPAGNVSAIFSRNFRFTATEWRKVYKNGGDFSTVGFAINPAPVKDFGKYASACRPSN